MERRIEDLEVKLAFVEKHVSELDELVREMADAIVTLGRELAQVRAQLDVASETGSLGDERPPHH